MDARPRRAAGPRLMVETLTAIARGGEVDRSPAARPFEANEPIGRRRRPTGARWDFAFRRTGPFRSRRRVTLPTTMAHDRTQLGIRLLPLGIEADHFKAVPGGWLVTVKRPFGSDWNHLASDAQKPTIAGRVRLATGIRFTLLIGWALIVIMGTRAGYTGEATISSFGLLFAMNACDYFSTRSVLRDLPVTPETVISRDRMRSRAEAMSIGALVIFMVVCLTAALGVAAAGFIAIGALLGIDKVSATIRAVIFIGVFALWVGAGLYWLRLLAIKLQAPRRNP